MTGYFDVLRSMTDDPELLRAADEAAAQATAPLTAARTEAER